jgi:hypothetical protein
VLEAAGIFALGLRGDPRFPIGFDLITFGMFATITAFTLVGAAIILRRPRTRVAWVMIGMGIALGTGALLGAYGVVFTATNGVSEAPFAFEAVVLSSIFFVPALGFGTATLLCLYPTDSLLGPRWRIVVLVALVGTIAWNVGALFRPGNIEHETLGHLPNPLAAPVELGPVLDALAGLGSLFTIVTIAVAAASLFVRYRRGDTVVRAQIRWFALIAVVVVVALLLATLFQPNGQAFFDIGIVAMAFLPVAIWIAISRYRLYDIDLLINRALVYGSLTAILAGVFAAGVGLAQRLFVAVTGQSSDAAVVLVTLVVATLYAPMRKRLEAIIDKRFKYETLRFGAYTDRVKTVLSVIDPARSAEKLASEAVAELGATGAAYRQHPGVVALGVALGLATYSLHTLAFAAAGHALTPDAPALDVHFLIVPLVLFSTAIPLPFGALGVSENVSDGLFRLVDYSGGVIAMLAFRTYVYSTAILGAGVYLANLAQVRTLRESAEHLADDLEPEPSAEEAAVQEEEEPAEQRAVPVGARPAATPMQFDDDELDVPDFLK